MNHTYGWIAVLEGVVSILCSSSLWKLGLFGLHCGVLGISDEVGLFIKRRGYISYSETKAVLNDDFELLIHLYI